MIRLITAVAIVGLCAVTALYGWSIVQFARATALPPSAAGDAYLKWAEFPGLRTASLDAALSGRVAAGDPDATRLRADMLAEYLSLRPLASAKWLSLAGTRLVMAQPRNATLAALTMSMMTGPNEGSVMWARGIFGLLAWDALSAEARTRIVADLTGAVRASAVDTDGMAEAKTVVATASPQMRSQIRAMLVAARMPATALVRLGL